MDAGNYEKIRWGSRSRAPLRQAASTVYVPPLRLTSSSISSPTKISGDRFIPVRSAIDFGFAHCMLTESTKEKEKEKENTATAAAATSPLKVLRSSVSNQMRRQASKRMGMREGKRRRERVKAAAQIQEGMQTVESWDLNFRPACTAVESWSKLSTVMKKCTAVHVKTVFSGRSYQDCRAVESSIENF